MTSAIITVLSLLLLSPALKAQQHHHDPLNDLEVERLRDAAQDPEVRLKLYVDFARARLDKLQQVHADEKAADRAQQMRAALQEFLDVYDELSVNVDTYADRGADLRTALKPVIEADTEFGSKLRAFKDSLTSSRQETENYDFLVSSALEAVDEAAKDHRDLLAEQEETFKHKKAKDRKEASRRSE